MQRDCYEIILNHNCDLRCAFCSQADFDPRAKMPLADAVRHIYRAKKAGYRRLGFSGGEALLRPDLPHLASAARKAGFGIVRLQTNGVRLADAALCRKLASSGLTVCKFTFAAHTAKAHDRLTGVSGSFRKSLRGLDNMLALKLMAGVNLLVVKQNYRGLEAAVKFFMDRGVANFTIIYPIYAGNMARNSRKLGVSLPQASRHITEALDLARAAGLGVRDIKALNVPPCLLPGHEENAVDLYKFNTMVASPLGRTWDIDSNITADKSRGPVCAACLFRRRCLGVDRHYLALYGWKGFKPVKKLPKKRRPVKEPGYLNGLEQCFMEVLKVKDNIPTAKVLSIARRLPLCHDCRDGASVLSTGESLIKKGLVKRDLVKGKYFWSLEERGS